MLEENPIIEELFKLARKTEHGLGAFLTETVEESIIEETSVRFRTFHLSLDSRGLPRTRDLHRALAHHILDYAIPRTKIEDAHNSYLSNKSTVKIIELEQRARALFSKVFNTGECGELLLFTLCEQLLGLPLVIAKMNLKTDNQVHFHGADGVYAGVNKSKKLVLYWGESKIYSDRSQAAEDCFSSISKLLLPNAGDPDEEERDLELLRDYSDLGDPTLTETFRKWLEKDNPAYNDLDFGAVCLIGFNEDEYPQEPKKKDNEALKMSISSKIKAYKKTISHYTNKHKIKNFDLISICLPIPSAEDFRSQFLEFVLNTKEAK